MYPNCCPSVVGIVTVLPCHEFSVQQSLHCALERPTRHCPAAALLLFVK
jgi:hypothetical protein